MQFLARFRLKAVEETIALCRKLSPEYLSAERIYEEFKKYILFGQDMMGGLSFLQDVHWLSFFPELAAMETCQQDTLYHPEGTVLTHIKYAMNAFRSLRPSDHWEALVIGFAILCHDLGKPACTQWNAVGRICAKGHEWAGVEPTRQFLLRLRAPQALLREVLPLTAYHMIPRTFSDKNLATMAALNHLAAAVGRIDRLLIVARCDRMGRSGDVPKFDGENCLEAMARASDLLTHPPRPLLLGRDLVKHFGLAPSPYIGKLMRQIYEAQLDATFVDRRGALAYAENLMATMVQK
jgi:tRNA nucleotidyltransferase (CCA-adding enzyme)